MSCMRSRSYKALSVYITVQFLQIPTIIYARAPRQHFGTSFFIFLTSCCLRAVSVASSRCCSSALSVSSSRWCKHTSLAACSLSVYTRSARCTMSSCFSRKCCSSCSPANAARSLSATRPRSTAAGTTAFPDISDILLNICCFFFFCLAEDVKAYPETGWLMLKSCAWSWQQLTRSVLQVSSAADWIQQNWSKPRPQKGVVLSPR